MKYLIIYLVLINIIGFIIYGVDKSKAKKGKWRIKEATLLSFSLIGGGIGSMISMNYFRHKTQTLKFKIGVPFLTIISILLLFLLIREFNL